MKDGRNWYTYGSNSPNSNVDPSGYENLVEQLFGAILNTYDNYSGTDGYDSNGNPIRVGRWPSKLNTNGNAETYNGTIHLKKLSDARKYAWQNHEEGHLLQGKAGPVAFLIAYAVWAYQGVDTPIITGTSGGGLGHDYDPLEVAAESYANEKAWWNRLGF